MCYSVITPAAKGAAGRTEGAAITEETIKLRLREPGAMQTITWGELKVGHIMRDERDLMHTVVNDLRGWVQLKSVRTGELSPRRRPAPDTPVDIYVPSEEECLVLLREDLGARMLRDVERREHTIARRLNWRLEPVANNAKALRDHLDMIHAVNVDDVLRKHSGTPVNPAPKGQKAAALAELRRLHDLTHEDPETWPMVFPHIHTLNPKETS